MTNTRPDFSRAMRSMGARNQFQPKMMMKRATNMTDASTALASHLSERASVMMVCGVLRTCCFP